MSATKHFGGKNAFNNETTKNVLCNTLSMGERITSTRHKPHEPQSRLAAVFNSNPTLPPAIFIRECFVCLTFECFMFHSLLLGLSYGLPVLPFLAYGIVSFQLPFV
ncbi:hypothetical protein OUZ56_022656 [Daphnia magna]|uniref:Uncharacterized protein n=1 Tax=Daphnia magna TaxID=35525 RepID=A0ABR0AX48_9CRUS|nr:hypothetical protein OUZ56_022656 [Daphnia magna]